MVDATHLRSEAVTMRITWWSRFLRRVSIVLVFLTPVGLVWTWTHFDQVAAFLPATAGIPYDPANVTPLIRIGAFFLNMVPGVIAMYGFLQLYRLFELFSIGRYFDADAIRRVRNFALTALTYGIAAPLSRFLIGVLVSMSNPPGERVFLLRISSDDLVIIFLSGVFFVIAGVWGKAKEIADENAAIV